MHAIECICPIEYTPPLQPGAVGRQSGASVVNVVLGLARTPQRSPETLGVSARTSTLLRPGPVRGQNGAALGKIG